MAATVFLHIGLPKTGTTYLQAVLWDNTDRLREHGIVLPGRGHREHLWAALDAQGRKHLESRHRRAPGAWARLVGELRRHPDTGVISHEFFCGASGEQARRVVEDLAPARVHLVLTARDALGMLTAGWQESVKNGGTGPLAQAGRHTKPGGNEFSWRTWDLGDVLRRWGPTVPPERVHVLPVPDRNEAPDQHWRNLAGVLGVPADGYQMPEGAANPSLGVVQVELLRRINAELTGFGRAVDRGRWIRGYLAEEHLAHQAGDRIAPGPAQVHGARARSERAVALIRANGFHVVGDVDRLLVPPDLPAARQPREVRPDELVNAAAKLVAGMVGDVRELAQGTSRRNGG